MRTLLVILTFNLLSFKGTLGAFTTTHATNIHSAVLGASYNKYVRPSEVTNINVEFVLFSLNGLDMKNEIMTTSGWMVATWSDFRLTWTASSYGNIEYIYTKQDKIWRPELLIDNSVEGMTPLGDDELFFKIKDTGVVQWEPPSLYVTACEIDVTYYPFDYQKCTIELISAMFTTDILTLNKSKDTVNTEDYSENGEWILYSTNVEEKILSENGENFSQLEFVLIFKRRPGYYLSNIVYPVILISLLANLAFLLPADSGERIGYVLTVLLALAVLLTLVGDSMPTTSKHTSILGMYISFVLLMSGLGIVFTILNLRLHLSPDQSDVPKWLQYFTHAVLLRVNCRRAKVKDKDMVKPLGDNLEIQDVDENVNSAKRPSESPTNQSESTEFPYQCSEVSAFLDFFIFSLFTIITVMVTVIFFIIIVIGDTPPV